MQNIMFYEKFVFTEFGCMCFFCIFDTCQIDDTRIHIFFIMVQHFSISERLVVDICSMCSKQRVFIIIQQSLVRHLHYWLRCNPQETKQNRTLLFLRAAGTINMFPLALASVTSRVQLCFVLSLWLLSGGFFIKFFCFESWLDCQRFDSFSFHILTFSLCVLFDPNRKHRFITAEHKEKSMMWHDMKGAERKPAKKNEIKRVLNL